MKRPKKAGPEPTPGGLATTSISLSAPLLEAGRRLAKAEDRTFSKLVERLLREAVQREENESQQP